MLPKISQFCLKFPNFDQDPAFFRLWFNTNTSRYVGPSVSYTFRFILSRCLRPVESVQLAKVHICLVHFRWWSSMAFFYTKKVKFNGKNLKFNGKKKLKFNTHWTWVFKFNCWTWVFKFNCWTWVFIWIILQWSITVVNMFRYRNEIGPFKQTN